MVHGEEPIAIMEEWRVMLCNSMGIKMQPRLSIRISYGLCYTRFWNCVKEVESVLEEVGTNAHEFYWESITLSMESIPFIGDSNSKT